MQIAENLRQLERDDTQVETVDRKSKEQASKEYHKQLDQLCMIKRLKETCDLKEKEKEKAIIDEIVKQIEEEDRKQSRYQLEKRRELRRQMGDLQRMREDIKLRKKQKENTEDWKVGEYKKVQELRAQEQEEKKHLELNLRFQGQYELLSHLERSRREKLQQEQLRINLSIKEKEAAEKSKSLEEEHEKRKIRDDLQRVYEMQLYLKNQEKELEKKEEQLFRQNLKAKLYEKDQLDLLSQQKKRQKQVEHQHAVEEALKDNHQRKIDEAAREISDLNQRHLADAERIRMVNEERARFRRKHAKDLVGCFPKRMFGDKETVMKLGEEFKKFYFDRD